MHEILELPLEIGMPVFAEVLRVQARVANDVTGATLRVAETNLRRKEAEGILALLSRARELKALA